MNRRFALLAAVCVCATLSPIAQAKPSDAQAKPAAQSTAPAAAPAAKWVPPVKGEATVDFIKSSPTRVKDEVQTKLKVKNTSKGSIALLSVEELWYNSKREIASNGIYRHRQLLPPGETIEFTISSPSKPDLQTNMLMFRHANGTIKPTSVKKLP
jgi:hypothetical protein